MRGQFEQSQFREAALNEELKGLKKRLISDSENYAGSASTIVSKEAELSETKEKLEAMKIAIENKSVLEKDLNQKLDQLEKDNEKLTKQMLKHMRRANELTETHEAVFTIFRKLSFFIYFQFDFQDGRETSDKDTEV